MGPTGDRIVVARLSDDDVRSMVDLWAKSDLAFKPKGRDRLESLRAQRRKTPDLFLGAFLEGRLVGTVIASDDGRRGWINRLAVLPGARRKGVAKLLIESAERALRKRGRHLFCIHVERGNMSSMHLFESAGYSRQEDIFYYAKRERPSY